MKTIDLYAESWEFYKAHTEAFIDDIQFYRDFCGNKKSLELFAGYGRVANRLISMGVDLETVELSANFAKQIALPSTRNHVADVLAFDPKRKFDRVYAAYNSFCLLTTDTAIDRFFKNLRGWLTDNGVACLSYYGVEFWKDAVPGEFDFGGRKIKYVPKWDLGQRGQGLGTWIDEYHDQGRIVTHRYDVRLHEDPKALDSLLRSSGLRLTSVTKDFNQAQVSEPGWVDYIVQPL